MPSRQIYRFKKLRVWESARRLVSSVYKATRAFPCSEICALTSQTNRAAVSVAANLAEGSSRTSRKDRGQFSQIAYGALMELSCLLILAVDLGFLLAEHESALRMEIKSVSRQLNALRVTQVSS